MMIEDDELARWARFTDKVRNQTLRLGRLLTAGRLTEARTLTLEMHLEAARTLTAMEIAGVELPAYLPPMQEVPGALRTSAANRRLYGLLVEADAAAREVDKERGQTAGWADFLTDKLSRVKRELDGTARQGEEG